MSLLEVGAKAPELSGVDQEGKPVRLKDYQGRKVVLYFYPKDDTPGCTAEACSLRDAHDELRESGYEVIGVSPDPEGKHRKFVDKYDLPFRLLADREFEGVLRTTYLIDEGGRIARVIDKVKTKEHARQVLEG